MPADVHQLAGHRVRAAIDRLKDCFEPAANGEQHEDHNHRVEQPAGATTQGLSSLDDDPACQHQEHWWPDPGEGVHHTLAGLKDDQGEADDPHVCGRHQSPALRLVGVASRENRNQTPAQPERQEHRAGDPRFGAASHRADDKDDRRHEPCE